MFFKLHLVDAELVLKEAQSLHRDQRDREEGEDSDWQNLGSVPRGTTRLTVNPPLLSRFG